jgi:hypothetical protein
VRQVLLGNLLPLAALMPPDKRGPDLLLPAVQLASSCGFWSVRAAAAAAVPQALAALCWPTEQQPPSWDMASPVEPAWLPACSCGGLANCESGQCNDGRRRVPTTGTDTETELANSAAPSSYPGDSPGFQALETATLLCHLLAEDLGTKDDSQWVRSAAEAAAGPAIACLPR